MIGSYFLTSKVIHSHKPASPRLAQKAKNTALETLKNLNNN